MKVLRRVRLISGSSGRVIADYNHLTGEYTAESGYFYGHIFVVREYDEEEECEAIAAGSTD